MSRQDRSVSGEDRAVSVTVGYVLNIVIMAMLMTGLVIGASSVIDSETNSAVLDEFEVLGQQVAAEAATMDRMIRIGQADNETLADPDDEYNASVDVRLPTTVAGSGYRIAIDDGVVTLISQQRDITVTVPVRTTKTIESDGTLQGGPIRIVYDDTEDRLLVVQR